jgi:hypothetical protein
MLQYYLGTIYMFQNLKNGEKMFVYLSLEFSYMYVL